MESCRQKQEENRQLMCDNLQTCEENIVGIKTIDWMRAENTWLVI